MTWDNEKATMAAFIRTRYGSSVHVVELDNTVQVSLPGAVVILTDGSPSFAETAGGRLTRVAKALDELLPMKCPCCDQVMPERK